MSDVMSTCRATWKRLGVAENARADLESELSADLAKAAEDGVDAINFVGGSPAAFAREWAVARGLVRARWHVVGCVVVSGLVGMASLAILDRLYFPAWLHRLVDQHGAVSESWLVIFGHLAIPFLLPIMLALAAYLLVMRDSLIARTVLFVLLASPVSIWACSEAARWVDLGRGGGGSLLFALLIALVIGAQRAAVVARSRTSADAGAATTPTRAPTD